MSKKSAGHKRVRKGAKQLGPASRADLDRLRKAMTREIDTGEIPEGKGFDRLKRDASGVLPRRKSMIREAVEQQRVRLQLSVYRLWQLASEHYPPLSQAAVHEFLKGQRQLELPSVEALLAAVNLQVVRLATAGRSQVKRATKTRPKTPPLRKSPISVMKK